MSAKFTQVTSKIIPMLIDNIDTDMIIPKNFLKTIKRSGLGQKLFYEMRFDEKGNAKSGCIVDDQIYKGANVILAGKNFGCGSSREHAPWALADYGIKCVISTSFADIFYNNCFKNCILPIVLDPQTYDELTSDVKASNLPKNFTIDLPNQKITCEGRIFTFDISPQRKQTLLEGLDDIAQTLKLGDKISQFETNDQRYWLKSAQ